MLVPLVHMFCVIDICTPQGPYLEDVYIEGTKRINFNTQQCYNTMQLSNLKASGYQGNNNLIPINSSTRYRLILEKVWTITHLYMLRGTLWLWQTAFYSFKRLSSFISLLQPYNLRYRPTLIDPSSLQISCFWSHKKLFATFTTDPTSHLLSLVVAWGTLWFTDVKTNDFNAKSHLPLLNLTAYIQLKFVWP